MNKVPRFISLMADTTAKALIKDDNYRWFYEEIIKFRTGVDLKCYRLMDPELNTGNRGKDYRLDLIFINKTKLFNLELNRFVYPHSFIKNLKYALRLAGNGYIKGDQYYQRFVTQLNLNYKIMSEKVKWQNSRDYKLEDCKYKDKLKDIRVLTTNLLDYKGIVYDGTNKYETYLSMLTAESYEEMEKIIGHLKEGKIIMEKLKELGLDDEFGAIYDEEIVHKMEINSARSDGRKEGRKEGKIETTTSIAKNLLNMGLSKQDVMKATGLSKKQLTMLM